MSYFITDDCIKCGACYDACPLGIISEGENKFVIDAEQCMDCGNCLVCPLDAIETD